MKFNEFREKLQESPSRDAPVILLMKRVGIRIFPTGERVALYKNQKLGLTFSVPYIYGSFGKGGDIVTSEEADYTLIESTNVIKRLNMIVQKNEIQEVHFNDGSSTRVDVTSAKSILQLYNQLNDSNKEKLSEKVNSNAEEFTTIAKFAFQNLN